MNLNCIYHVLKNGYEYQTSAYGYRTSPITGQPNTFHGGQDLINSKYGSDYIIAFEDGIVTATRNTINGVDHSNASGNYVYIDHGNGYETRYIHLKKDSITVKKGDTIKKGQTIGFMGLTGSVTGVHLHWEVRLNGATQNPCDYLMGVKSIKKGTVTSITSSNNTYIVKSGDTLSKIAKKFNTTWQELARINNIANANLIKVNQVIKLSNDTSTATTYIVQKGDTLSSIAKKYNTTWQSIYEKNKSIIGSNANLIIAGQKLNI